MTMNNNKQQTHSLRTYIILGMILLIGIGSAVAIYLVRQRTNIKQKAAAATTISFSPGSASVGVGQTVTADVQLDPGNNQVSLLKLVISYDPTKFNENSAKIIPNL